MSDWSNIGLPCPLLAGYGYTRDIGLARTSFETAQPRQMQGWKDKRETFPVSFAVRAEQLSAIEAFFAADASSWFTMPLVSGDTGAVADLTVRAITPCQVTLLTGDWWKIGFTAETKIDTVAPDLTEPGFTCVDEPCCAPDDFQCCEGIMCVEFTEIRNTPPYYTDAEGYLTAALPNVGKVLAMGAKSNGTNIWAATSTDGLTWEMAASTLPTTKKYLDVAAQWTQVGNLVCVWGRITTTKKTWIAFTEDGETWTEHELPRNGTLTPGVESVVYAESLGEYWIFGSYYASSGYTDAWKTSDDPLSPTATWTVVLDTDMSFTGGSWSADYFLEVEWFEAAKLFFMTVATNDCGTEYPYSFCDTAIYSSPDGITWTARPLPNTWQTSLPTMIATPSKLVMISGVSMTNGVMDDPEAGWWVFGTTDGSTWTRLGHLPEPYLLTSPYPYYFHESPYDMKPVYNPGNEHIVLASISDHWIGSFVYSPDGGTTWIHKDARFDVDGYPDTFYADRAVYGYGYLPDTGKFSLITTQGSYPAEEDPPAALLLWDSDCATADPPRVY